MWLSRPLLVLFLLNCIGNMLPKHVTTFMSWPRRVTTTVRYFIALLRFLHSLPLAVFDSLTNVTLCDKRILCARVEIPQEQDEGVSLFMGTHFVTKLQVNDANNFTFLFFCLFVFSVANLKMRSQENLNTRARGYFQWQTLERIQTEVSFLSHLHLVHGIIDKKSSV